MNVDEQAQIRLPALSSLGRLPKSGVSSSFLPEKTNRHRITREKMKRHRITPNGEIVALGYPRAALFALGVALVAYNIMSALKAS